MVPWYIILHDFCRWWCGILCVGENNVSRFHLLWFYSHLTGQLNLRQGKTYANEECQRHCNDHECMFTCKTWFSLNSYLRIASATDAGTLAISISWYAVQRHTHSFQISQNTAMIHQSNSGRSKKWIQITGSFSFLSKKSKIEWPPLKTAHDFFLRGSAPPCLFCKLLIRLLPTARPTI